MVDAGHDAHEDAADGEADAAGGSNGDPCAADGDCQSGACVAELGGASICCASRCTVCEVCAAGGAACAPLPEGRTAPSCDGALACDGAGQCKVKNGGGCPPDGGDGICLSGQCTFEGACCVTKCPACQACAEDGSGCVNKPFGTYDPRCVSGVGHGCNGKGDCAGL